MNPAKLEQFAEAYARTIADVLREWGPGRPSPEVPADQYAVDAALAMVDQIGSNGADSAQHYYLNVNRGALKRTCAALGIPNTSAAVDDFLRG